MLGQIHPMRTDVADDAEGAIGGLLDAPVVVGVVEQPVLRVAALNDENVAQVAGLDHARICCTTG